MIGALLGDVVKGPLKGEHPQRWEQGIQLHRQIDAYTDCHPAIKACAEKFPSPFRRYSGIILDVAFDHYLIKHWQLHHQQAFSSFTQEVYQLLSDTHWPEEAQEKANRIVQFDLLNNYQDWSFIIDVLANIGKRLRHQNPLAQAAPPLKQLAPHIEQTFLGFYPQLTEFAQKKRRNFDLPQS